MTEEEPMVVDLIKNKKVCLLCPGKSLEKHKIDYSKYDLVCGVNRIYKTDYFDKINLFFHNASINDTPNKICDKVFSQKDNKQRYIVFVPGEISKIRFSIFKELDKTTIKYNNVLCLYSIHQQLINTFGFNLLSGLMCVYLMLQLKVEHIDIYGMDFYSHGYINGTNKAPLREFDIEHSLASNLVFLKNLIKHNPKKINWINKNKG